MWRPKVSSVSLADWRRIISFFPQEELNWSVWEYKQARAGDRFFMVRVGEGRTGVVASGNFGSAPYKGEDWSGKGRETFYADLDFDHIFDSERVPLLSADTLSEAIPGFDWTKGHSGRMLDACQADRLEGLWLDHLLEIGEETYNTPSGLAARCERATTERCIEIAVAALDGQTDLDGLPAVYHSLRVGLAGASEQERQTGFLHDVLEDGLDYTLQELMWQGVDVRVLQALRLLTHRKETDYYDYVASIVSSGNALARAVKLNDLRDNLRRGRAGGHLKQVAKHERALRMFGESE